MRIVLCGLPGAGKSFIGKKLAKKLGLDFLSASVLLEDFARKEGHEVTKNWWDTQEGLEFFKERETNFKMDKQVDNYLKKLLDEGDIVITSWTMPWLYEKKAAKIWLKASLEERKRRIANRDNISEEKALEVIKKRDKENKTLYKKMYGFEFGKDFSPFQLKVDTEKNSAEEIISEILEFLHDFY